MKQIATIGLLVLALGLAVRAEAGVVRISGDTVGWQSPVDLNGDGQDDFRFWVSMMVTMSIPSHSYDAVGVEALGENAVLTGGTWACGVAAGTVIGPTAPGAAWWEQHNAALQIAGNRDGQGWAGDVASPEGAYLGLQFLAADGVHYGWVHVSLPAPTGENPMFVLSWPQILDLAYESTPGAPMVAGAVPEPAAGMLLTGLAGVLVWRRRR